MTNPLHLEHREHVEQRDDHVLLEAGIETGFWDDYGRPAPSPTTSTTTGGQPPTNRPRSNPANSPSNPYPQLEGSRSRFTTPGDLTQLDAKRSCRCIPLNQRSTTFGIL